MLGNSQLIKLMDKPDEQELIIVELKLNAFLLNRENQNIYLAFMRI